MDIDDLNEVARQAASAAEQMELIVDSSAAATIKKFLEQSPLVQVQRALESSVATKLQNQLNASLQSQRVLEEVAAKFYAIESIAAQAAKLNAFDSIAAQAAERLRFFDSAAVQAADRIRSAFENSAAAQAVAKLESSFAATMAAQKYVEDQVAMWDRATSSILQEKAHVVSPQVASFKIKASIPKVPISAQAKPEYVPAPDADPKIEMPPVHWLALALDFILTKGAYKRTVEPILADVYDEYYEQINKGEKVRAKWIVARGCCLIIWGQLVRPLIAISNWLTTLES